ncbi:chloramphenicol acetyltransferase [Mucilaginibacter sp. BJC16-A38]|uniref:chloramphenicol acetyltransferase n=1 Tax=Mucilaginibacter phenanthrenivorans TaxID=1234842 RepID=UPI00215754E3|nr:chloramphenicol acetyltransferase [Mucilaginibacter phenanthrenivorans]MCR8558075.1 chloramphenicol acetyltransferase [Mucilaginibacter phenanthrenivorans]
MRQKLDLETWARREHFNLFSKFDEPFYGVCVRVDCTAAYQIAKANGVSFYLYCLYNSLSAANAIVPFKLRIEDGDVFIYDRIDAASTIPRANGTFGFGYIDYHPTFTEYIPAANAEVERVKGRNDLELASRQNIIRYSSLPWIDFTSISHARVFSGTDTGPSISFGKMTEFEGKRSMPMSVHVHHALVDGLHVGQYIDCFQQLMNKKG